MSLVYTLVIRMSLKCTGLSSVVTRIYSYVTRMSLVCHPYVNRLYSYVIRMALVCHPYVFVCHLYVTHIYSYVTRMSVVCGFTMNHMGSCTMNHMNMFYIIPEIFLLRLLRSKKDRRSICYICPQIIENK